MTLTVPTTFLALLALYLYTHSHNPLRFTPLLLCTVKRSLIPQLDKEVLDEIAAGSPQAQNKSLLKFWCQYDYVIDNPQHEEWHHMPDMPEWMHLAMGALHLMTSTAAPTRKVGTVECKSV